MKTKRFEDGERFKSGVFCAVYLSCFFLTSSTECTIVIRKQLCTSRQILPHSAKIDTKFFKANKNSVVQMISTKVSQFSKNEKTVALTSLKHYFLYLNIMIQLSLKANNWGWVTFSQKIHSVNLNYYSKSLVVSAISKLFVFAWGWSLNSTQSIFLIFEFKAFDSIVLNFRWLTN